MSLLIGRKGVAIIGANSVLGISLSKQIPKEWARFMVYHRNGGDGGGWPNERGEFIYGGCDVTNAADAMACATCIAEQGIEQVHVVLCSADTRFLGSGLDAMLYTDEIQKQLMINVAGPLIVASAFFHAIWKHRVGAPIGSSLTLVSSLSSINVYPDSGQAVYSASKAALNVLTRHLADEIGPFCVRVNCVAPDTFPRAVSLEKLGGVILRLISTPVSGLIVKVSD